MTARSPDPAAEAVSALREALCFHYWHGAFGITTSLSWRRAVIQAEERGPGSAAAEQVRRFRDCADRQIAGPLAPLLADIAALRTRAGELQGLLATQEICADKLKADRDRLAEENARLRSTGAGRSEAEADLRRHWADFCDADPTPDGFVERMEVAGLAELRGVNRDDLEDPFAAERGIYKGGSLWALTPAGRAALASPASGEDADAGH